MQLKQYIREVGYKKAAELFDVPQRTVEGWARGQRQPRPAKAWEIEDTTHGVVKFAECYPREDLVA